MPLVSKYMLKRNGVIALYKYHVLDLDKSYVLAYLKIKTLMDNIKLVW